MTREEFIYEREMIKLEQGIIDNEMKSIQKKYNEACEKEKALVRKYAEKVSPFKIGSIVRFKVAENGEAKEIVFRVNDMSYYEDAMRPKIPNFIIEGRKLCKDGKTLSMANKDRVYFTYAINEAIESEKLNHFWYTAHEYVETIKTESND